MLFHNRRLDLQRYEPPSVLRESFIGLKSDTRVLINAPLALIRDPRFAGRDAMVLQEIGDVVAHSEVGTRFVAEQFFFGD